MSIEEGIIEKFQTDWTINIDHLQERFLIGHLAEMPPRYSFSKLVASLVTPTVSNAM